MVPEDDPFHPNQLDSPETYPTGQGVLGEGPVVQVTNSLRSSRPYGS